MADEPLLLPGARVSRRARNEAWRTIRLVRRARAAAQARGYQTFGVWYPGDKSGRGPYTAVFAAAIGERASLPDIWRDERLPVAVLFGQPVIVAAPDRDAADRLVKEGLKAREGAGFVAPIQVMWAPPPTTAGGCLFLARRALAQLANEKDSEDRERRINLMWEASYWGHVYLQTAGLDLEAAVWRGLSRAIEGLKNNK